MYRQLSTMYIFRGEKEVSKLLRAYTFKHCYEQARLIQKQKNPVLVSHCLIIRKVAIRNNTDFGYKEELRTGILKKIHFVYLTDIEDLLTFLIVHLQSKDLSFAMLLLENAQDFFGDTFEYKQCGKSFTLVYKMMKSIAARLKKGRVCLSYVYNSKIFKRQNLMSFIKHENDTDWQIVATAVRRNGDVCQNEFSRGFFAIYRENDEN